MIQAKLTVSYDPKKLTTKLQNAQTKALEAAIFRWETEAKMITTLENHVVTGRYRASINNNTGDGYSHPSSGASEEGDGIHVVVKYNEIRAGSNVKYAASLEKKYGLMLRALDKAKDKMLKSYADVLIQAI